MHNSDNIINFASVISSMIGVFRSLRYDSDLNSASLLNQAVSKLPPNMRESWSLHTVKQDMYQPTLIHFAAWLKDKAEAHERMKSTTFPKSRVEDAVKSKTSSKVFAGASQGSKPVPSSSSSTTNFDPCIVCKGKHPLWKCVVFKEKTPTQRAKEQLEMTRFTTSIC